MLAGVGVFRVWCMRPYATACYGSIILPAILRRRWTFTINLLRGHGGILIHVSGAVLSVRFAFNPIPVVRVFDSGPRRGLIAS